MLILALNRLSAAALIAVSLGGCVTEPASVASDDTALCRYSEGTSGQRYSQCLGRLERMRMRVSAESAARIEGYALLRASDPKTTDVAGRCNDKETDAVKDCKSDDVTGSVPKTKR